MDCMPSEGTATGIIAGLYACAVCGGSLPEHGVFVEDGVRRCGMSGGESASMGEESGRVRCTSSCRPFFGRTSVIRQRMKASTSRKGLLSLIP